MHDPQRRVSCLWETNHLLWATLLAITSLAPMGCDRQPAATPASPKPEAVQRVPLKPDAAEPTVPESSASESSLPDPQASSDDASVSDLASVEHLEASKDRLEQPQVGEEVLSAIANDGTDRDTQKAETPERAPYRLLLPTTAGPLLVDLDIHVDGRPLAEVFDRRIESIAEAARGDAADLTWHGLFKYIEANPQPFGRSRIDAQQYRNMIQMYDRNRNKQPDAEEIALFLFRDSGFSGPFRMVGTNFFRQMNRSQSPLFKALDQNGNRILEPDEIEIAYQSLGQLDRNGDRRLDAAEVMTPPRGNGSINDAWSNRHTSRWGDVAMDLGGFVDWSMVSYSLDEAPRQGVFHAGPNAIDGLDRDGDETIDQDESQGILEVPADIRMQIQFDSTRSSEPQIEVVVPDREEAVVVENTATKDRVRIASERFQLIAMVRDLRRHTDTIPQEAFAAIDANKDGGLDETEIPTGVLREYSFEDLDQDNDGKLTHRELVEGMRAVDPIWTSQVRARGAEAPDAVFTWLDRDDNGLLSTRELLGCQERLLKLAAPTGSLRATDFPDTYLIQFGRSDPQQQEQLFALATTRVQADRPWPRWAESMDANRDGDISREEFLGQPEQFDPLDQNGDGFLSGFELTSGDATQSEP